MIESVQALCNKFVPLGIDEKRISAKFNTLTGEFAIPETEAVRMISQGLEKELGITTEDGTRNSGYEPRFTHISDITRDMLDADIRGQLLTLEIPKSPKLQYAAPIVTGKQIGRAHV